MYEQPRQSGAYSGDSDSDNQRNRFSNSSESFRSNNTTGFNKTYSNRGSNNRYGNNYNGGKYQSNKNSQSFNSYNYRQDSRRYNQFYERNNERSGYAGYLNKQVDRDCLYNSDKREKKQNYNSQKTKNQEIEGMNQRESLTWQLTNNTYECMICFSNIRAESPTWSCDNCFHIFHIICIKKWTMKSSDNSDSRPTEGCIWSARCPACQKIHNFNTIGEASSSSLSLVYYCWCGKEKNPVYRRGGSNVPHSCESICGKALSITGAGSTTYNKSDEIEGLELGDKGEIAEKREKKERICSHQCVLPCHPGPCPPCDALVSRYCPCGATRVTAKCSADEKTLVCGNCCEAPLNCGLHRCKQSCHVGECSPCDKELRQRCFCDKKQERRVICGGGDASAILVTLNESDETEEIKNLDIIDETKETKNSEIIDENGSFSCGVTCGRLLDCGNHRCEQLCHIGECVGCELSPNKLDRCWCSRKSQAELGCERKSCLDAVESCGSRCGKKMVVCGHECDRKCHPGPCEPCPLFEDRLCRCGKSLITNVACASLTCDRNISENIDQIGENNLNNSPYSGVLCKSVCRKKLMCGRHKCGVRCCGLELHWCSQTCGRPLSCGKHRCERECGHAGHCPPCQNVSFEEATCECGRSRELPPIACGQAPPSCSETCSRQHSCDHPVRHNCHSESDCPPCTQLMSKPCPGGHTILDNVPCFRAVVTCGLPCNRPLSDCDHLCQRLCHSGNCYDSTATDATTVARCQQPCLKQRSDCSHACNAPCHPNIDCQSVWSRCCALVTLYCSCKTRSTQLTCSKLENVISIVKFKSGSDMRRDSSDPGIIIAPGTAAPSLPCDSECKKLARNAKLADALDITVTLSNFNTHYSESLKTFAKNNIDYLLFVENFLLDLTKKTTEVTCKTTVKSISDDKADFLSRYSTCFKMTCKYAQNKSTNKGNTVIEINRANCCLPKPLLSELLRTECPDLFPLKIENEKSTIVTTGSLNMSFADKIRLSKKE